MNIIEATILCSCLLLAAAVFPPAKEWRGIVPLHSTRADVERLLGQPTKPGGSIYDLGSESASILYASGAPCGDDSPSGWQVPRDTVISVTVYSETKSPLSDLKIDRSKYKRVDGGHLPDVFYYINEEEGVKIEVVHSNVAGITYFPAAKDSHLRCPDNRQKPPELFSSGELTAAGKELLASFMRRLGQEPDVTGWVRVNLEGKRAEEAEMLADRVCRHLKRNYHTTFGRVTITEGFRLSRDMELYIMRSDGVLIPFPDKSSKLKD
jgi:hypothetical protein